MEDVYNAVKSSSCSQKTFDALSLQDFITLGSIATRCCLKCPSLAPYYAAQMKCCTQKWDRHDDQGLGSEVVNTCHQLIGVVGTGLYHSMADVQMMVRLNCGSILTSTNSTFWAKDGMHCVNNVVIMQTEQLGRIETLEERLHNLEGCNQDLEHKLAEQDCVIANLVGDNLEHLQDNIRLTTHINSSQARMALLEE